MSIRTVFSRLTPYIKPVGNAVPAFVVVMSFGSLAYNMAKDEKPTPSAACIAEYHPAFCSTPRPAARP